MSESTPDNAAGLSGAMFLYERPEILNPTTHAGMGLLYPPAPFDFAAKIKAVPVISGEFINLQRHYPIVFTALDNPAPIAVVGFKDHNLFVTPEGDWEHGCYIPSYLRRYPFALADRPNDTPIVVIDGASKRVGKDARHPFFDASNEVTQETRSMMDFCRNYGQESERTKTFCERLQAHNLLINQTAQQTTADGQTQHDIASFVTIDPQKLAQLPEKLAAEWLVDGTLAAIYAQLFSMQNWNHLMERAVRDEQGTAQST